TQKGEETTTFGPKTKAALIKFQLEHHLISSSKDPSAGLFGPKTKAAVAAALAGSPVNQAQAGNQVISGSGNQQAAGGSEIKSLQVFLNEHGFTVSSSGAGSKGQETATFGSATKAALIQFQLKYGLISSQKDEGAGVLGPKTKKKMGEVG